MKILLTALLAGIIFGLGLCVSEMVNPARVIGFLDITGKWDATLIFVMGGAIIVAATGFTLTKRRTKPLLTDEFSLPTKHDIDFQLVLGSVLFGIGWGLAGLCPGPALAALVSLSPEIFTFVLAMVIGQLLVRPVQRIFN